MAKPFKFSDKRIEGPTPRGGVCWIVHPGGERIEIDSQGQAIRPEAPDARAKPGARAESDG